MSELRHEIEISPAYDHRAEGKGQNCVDMTWYVTGPKGVIQFRLFTGWGKQIIPTPERPWQELNIPYPCGHDQGLWEPMPADLGYHSYVPLYEEQTTMGSCPRLGGKDCYYDGSGLNAYRIFSILVHEGGDAVWAALEAEYELRFKDVEAEGLRREQKGTRG